MQLVRPVWFIVAGVQVLPIRWHVPHAVLVIGATVWALAPSGVPAGLAWPGVLWQPDWAQLVAAV